MHCIGVLRVNHNIWTLVVYNKLSRFVVTIGLGINLGVEQQKPIVITTHYIIIARNVEFLNCSHVKLRIIKIARG